MVNWKDTSGPIRRNRNTFGMPPRAINPVSIGTGSSATQNSIGSQEIEVPRRSRILQEFRNAEPHDTFTNIISSEHKDPLPILSKVIGSKFTNKSSADIYSQCRMNLASDTVLSEVQTSWIWGCRPSTQRLNLGPSLPPQP